MKVKHLKKVDGEEPNGMVLLRELKRPKKKVELLESESKMLQQMTAMVLDYAV